MKIKHKFGAFHETTKQPFFKPILAESNNSAMSGLPVSAFCLWDG
jgi:hypothetical protein